jgi:hypothetical protein
MQDWPISIQAHGNQSNENSRFHSILLFPKYVLLILSRSGHTRSTIQLDSLEDMPGMSMIWLSLWSKPPQDIRKTALSWNSKDLG